MFAELFVSMDLISWIVIISFAFHCRHTHFLSCKGPTPLNQLNCHFFRVSLSPHSFFHMQRSHALESVEFSFLSRFAVATLIFSQAKVPRLWISWIVISFAFHCRHTHFLSGKGPTSLNRQSFNNEVHQGVFLVESGYGWQAEKTCQFCTKLYKAFSLDNTFVLANQVKHGVNHAYLH